MNLISSTSDVASALNNDTETDTVVLDLSKHLIPQLTIDDVRNCVLATNMEYRDDYYYYYYSFTACVS